MSGPLFLGLDEVIEIHRDQLQRYGGRPGVRDMGLLQAAIAVPQAGGPAGYYHADLFEMAAAYLFHLAKNHPFVDGNKRTAAVAALVFLDLNGVEIRASNHDLYETVMAVANGRLAKSAVAEFLRRHARSGPPSG